MLLLSRKMSFENGIVTLYEQNIVIFPPQSMRDHIAFASINKENGMIKNLYYSAKESMFNHREKIAEIYKTSEGKNWVCDYINMFGQGKIVYENSHNSPSGIILLYNSPYAKDIKDGSNVPVDHIIRGIIAGVLSAALGKDFDAIELYCARVNGDKCKIMVGLKEKLLKSFNEVCIEQI
jgi:predicted hydrocarbon binding protein